MLIHLHKKATTTLAIREYIRTCGKPIKTLARELNLNAATVRKWRERESVQDVSHRPHRMQTTLSRSQELLVIELRRTLLLSLDDLTAITRTYIHSNASRAAIGRLLKREGISRLAIRKRMVWLNVSMAASLSCSDALIFAMPTSLLQRLITI